MRAITKSGPENHSGSAGKIWQSVRRVFAVITAAILVVLAVPTAAHADIVSNTVVAGGSPTVVAGETTSIGYSIQNQNTKQDGTRRITATPTTRHPPPLG